MDGILLKLTCDPPNKVLEAICKFDEERGNLALGLFSIADISMSWFAEHFGKDTDIQLISGVPHFLLVEKSFWQVLRFHGREVGKSSSNAIS